MRITLRVLARWLAIGGLWALIVLLLIPTLLAQAITGVGLFLTEPLRRMVDELLRSVAGDD